MTPFHIAILFGKLRPVTDADCQGSVVEVRGVRPCILTFLFAAERSNLLDSKMQDLTRCSHG
jgi:hypothetical protein